MQGPSLNPKTFQLVVIGSKNIPDEEILCFPVGHACRFWTLNKSTCNWITVDTATSTNNNKGETVGPDWWGKSMNQINRYNSLERMIIFREDSSNKILLPHYPRHFHAQVPSNVGTTERSVIEGQRVRIWQYGLYWHEGRQQGASEGGKYMQNTAVTHCPIIN